MTKPIFITLTKKDGSPVLVIPSEISGIEHFEGGYCQNSHRKVTMKNGTKYEVVDFPSEIVKMIDEAQDE